MGSVDVSTVQEGTKDSFGVQDPEIEIHELIIKMSQMSEEKIGCLGILMKLFGIKVPAVVSEDQLPYELNASILSAAENSFFQTLKLAVPENACVMAKVRLADFLKVSTRERWQSHFNRISAKHIDFLICEKATMRPTVAIELHDKSHQAERRRKRDDFVRAAITQAGLPMVEIAASRTYTVEELRSTLDQCR